MVHDVLVSHDPVTPCTANTCEPDRRRHGSAVDGYLEVERRPNGRQIPDSSVDIFGVLSACARFHCGVGERTGRASVRPGRSFKSYDVLLESLFPQRCRSEHKPVCITQLHNHHCSSGNSRTGESGCRRDKRRHIQSVPFVVRNIPCLGNFQSAGFDTVRFCDDARRRFNGVINKQERFSPAKWTLLLESQGKERRRDRFVFLQSIILDSSPSTIAPLSGNKFDQSAGSTDARLVHGLRSNTLPHSGFNELILCELCEQHYHNG